MRLTLVIHSLAAGGAERVMSTLANHWARAGHAVTLITLAGEAPFYPLEAAVTRDALDVAGPSTGVLDAARKAMGRVRALRRAIRESRPDLVLSFVDATNVQVLLATRGLGLPVVVAERTDPSQNPIGRVWTTLRRWTYPHASAVVAQTRGAAAYFGPGVRTAVIPNPLPAPAITAAGGSRRVLALGRLIALKRYDLLLEAFGRVADRHPGWSLTIWGEGPERQALERQRAALGLDDRVELPGLTRDAYASLADGAIFAMTSRYEGFPNALCEAMASGLACVSFDCPSGPADIIHHGDDGLLLPPGDVEALTVALDRLMADDAERQRLGANARALAERLAPERVAATWEALFAGLMTPGSDAA